MFYQEIRRIMKGGDQDGPEINNKIDPKIIYTKGVNIEVSISEPSELWGTN